MKRYKVLKAYSNRKVGDVIEYERGSNTPQLIVADAVALELGVLEELRSGREQVIEELRNRLFTHDITGVNAEIALEFFEVRLNRLKPTWAKQDYVLYLGGKQDGKNSFECVREALFGEDAS